MSEFIDRLRQISQTGPQPMGFRATQPTSAKPRIQLVASVAVEDINNLADYTTGADAALLRISKSDSGTKTLQKITEAEPELLWGVWPGNNAKRTKQLVKSGCDFVVFPATSTSLAALQNDEVGRIVQVETTLSDDLLRAVNELPVDAVLIDNEQEGKYSLTWYHLMLFQRFVMLLTKPLLVMIPPKVTIKELQALWEAGVDGVVVETGAGQPTDELKRLRRIIDELAFPAPQKKREALLPSTSKNTETMAEVEEEED